MSIQDPTRELEWADHFTHCHKAHQKACPTMPDNTCKVLGVYAAVLFNFYLILLTHEESHKEVYQDFQFKLTFSIGCGQSFCSWNNLKIRLEHCNKGLLAAAFFILLTHEGSHSEVCQEFQLSYDIFRRWRQGLFRPQVPCTSSLHCPIANSASTQSQ